LISHTFFSAENHFFWEISTKFSLDFPKFQFSIKKTGNAVPKADAVPEADNVRAAYDVRAANDDLAADDVLAADFSPRAAGQGGNFRV
jgi:hypothetical protein